MTLATAMSGCLASRSETFAPVAAGATARTGYAVAWRSPMMSDARVRESVAELLSGGLELDEAIRIGLVNDRRLQSAFDQLGIARGDLATASVVRNPRLSAEVRFSSGGDPDVELDAVQDVVGLVTRGRRRSVASAELESARRDAIGAVVDLVAGVRSAYYEAQAAEQLFEMRRTIAAATEASHILALRLHEAGNITDRELLLQRDPYEQARVDLMGAEAARAESRELLSAALGLWGPEATTWTLSGRLEPPPSDADEIDLGQLERVAVERSLELDAARWRLRAAGGRVGLARIDRWLPELGVGVSAERDGGSGDWGLGPAVAVAVPIWNWNSGSIARGEAQRSQLQHRYRALAVNVRAEARAARVRLRAARARALAYRDTILPLRAELVEETLRARNAMAASSFELFEAKRRQIEAGAAYVRALLDYWRARAVVDQLLAGRRPDAASVTTGAYP